MVHSWSIAGKPCLAADYHGSYSNGSGIEITLGAFDAQPLGMVGFREVARLSYRRENPLTGNGKVWQGHDLSLVA